MSVSSMSNPFVIEKYQVKRGDRVYCARCGHGWVVTSPHPGRKGHRNCSKCGSKHYYKKEWMGEE